MNPHLILTIALVALSFSRVFPQASLPPPQINVSGSAEVKVAPDEIHLSVGVETRHEAIEDAKRQSDERITKALGIIKSSGVADKDVQADFVSVEPIYDEKVYRTKPTTPTLHHSYTREQVMGYLRERNVSISYYFDLRRDASGSKVFISPYASKSNNTVIVASSNGISVVNTPGRISFFNAADEVVAWSDDLSKSVSLKSGFELKLPQYALFDIEPSGEYFVIGEKPTYSWLGRIDQPQLRTCVSSNLLGTRLFKAGDNLFLCGQTFEGKTRLGHNAQSAACLVIGMNNHEWTVKERLVFPNFDGIVDINARGGKFLLRTASDFSPKWVVYDVGTKASQKVGPASGWAFFLMDDIFRANNRPLK